MQSILSSNVTSWRLTKPMMQAVNCKTVKLAPLVLGCSTALQGYQPSPHPPSWHPWAEINHRAPIALTSTSFKLGKKCFSSHIPTQPNKFCLLFRRIVSFALFAGSSLGLRYPVSSTFPAFWLCGIGKVLFISLVVQLMQLKSASCATVTPSSTASSASKAKQCAKVTLQTAS